MHQARNLTWKQERFVSEYLLSGNAAEAVRRAGYQTRYPSEIGYGLKRHPKVRSSTSEFVNAIVLPSIGPLSCPSKIPTANVLKC